MYTKGLQGNTWNISKVVAVATTATDLPPLQHGNTNYCLFGAAVTTGNGRAAATFVASYV